MILLKKKIHSDFESNAYRDNVLLKCTQIANLYIVQFDAFVYALNKSIIFE